MPAGAKTVAASKTVMSRTMLPSDANPYGNVHGGEIMKLIDEVAGATKQLEQNGFHGFD